MTDLLVPITATSPAGESLRFDAIYDEIRKLREQDDATLPRGVWQRELKRADWGGVAALCTEALRSRTKDLQIAAWLTEAWVQLEGFHGLDQGVRLMAALCREFWDVLHPEIEDGQLDARLAPVAWVADKLVLPLKSVRVTAPGGDESSPYGWKDWESGAYLSNLQKTNAAAAAKAQEQGMVPQAKFMVSVSLTPAPWYVARAAELASAMAALDELDAVLTEKCGDAAPSLTPVRAVVVAVHAFVSRIVGERAEKGELPDMTIEATSGEAVPFEEAALVPITEETAQQAHPAPAVPGRIGSRTEAYQRLREASDYLLRTEPHSPVPYLVRRAISWGNMSLAELLDELLQKNADINTINALLGLKKPS